MQRRVCTLINELRERALLYEFKLSFVHLVNLINDGIIGKHLPP